MKFLTYFETSDEIAEYLFKKEISWEAILSRDLSRIKELTPSPLDLKFTEIFSQLISSQSLSASLNMLLFFSNLNYDFPT